MTPRRTQQRRPNQQAQHISNQSADYDSDATYPAMSPRRTHDELNLAVLQRYVPSLVRILARSPKAELYTFSVDTQKWESAEIEGFIFIGSMTPSPITGSQRHCIVVLNKRGLENLIIESGEIETVQTIEEFLYLGIRRGVGEDSKLTVVGFHIEGDPQGHSKDYIWKLIKEHWEIAKMDQYRNGQQQAVSYDAEVMESIEGGANPPLRRRLSLSELFGTR